MTYCSSTTPANVGDVGENDHAEYDALKARLIAQLTVAPPTERDQQISSLNYAYGNLAASTRHAPSRRAFVELAQRRYAWSAEEAEEWALTKEWIRP